MKFFKWKSFVITSVVCLLPILLGLSLWSRLPETMAIHFDFYGNPDNFASRGFVVFGLPVMMVLLQGICCLISDFNAHKHGERKKFETAMKWLIPGLTIALQIITLGYGLGWNIDIRKSVCFILGVMFLVIGNYLPKFDRVKNFNLDAERAKKVNRFIGYETVILGFLYIVSVFLPAEYALFTLILLIPYAIIAIVYSIKIAREK